MLCSRDPPTESENAPRVAASLLAALVKKLFGFVDCGRARRQRCQLHEVPTVQGQFGDFLRGDDLPKVGLVVSTATSVAFTSTVVLTDAGCEGEIQFALFVHLQADVFLLGRTEALGLNVNRVERRREATE